MVRRRVQVLLALENVPVREIPRVAAHLPHLARLVPLEKRTLTPLGARGPLRNSFVPRLARSATRERRPDPLRSSSATPEKLSLPFECPHGDPSGPGATCRCPAPIGVRSIPAMGKI